MLEAREDPGVSPFVSVDVVDRDWEFELTLELEFVFGLALTFEFVGLLEAVGSIPELAVSLFQVSGNGKNNSLV